MMQKTSIAAAFVATSVFVAVGNANIVSLTPAEINGGDTNRATYTTAGGDLTISALLGSAPSTFNANATRLGNDNAGTPNVNSFNDPDTDPNNGNEEKFQLAFGPLAGLDGFSYDFSRALVSISGFISDPGLAVTPGDNVTVNAYDPITGTASFFSAGAGFSGTPRFVTVNPVASAGQTLLVSTTDANQAGAQLAVLGITYENAVVVPDPASLGMLGLAGAALIRRRR